ncbi:hypothetical protein KCP76_15510 [Salmonella enterica subsp. enterica serovar Weltevreden]|nr:hypothetical protein KCP76_15510 [Salmonella enterica subsp. enterica serovar Weltevreden]
MTAVIQIDFIGKVRKNRRVKSVTPLSFDVEQYSGEIKNLTGDVWMCYAVCKIITPIPSMPVYIVPLSTPNRTGFVYPDHFEYSDVGRCGICLVLNDHC